MIKFNFLKKTSLTIGLMFFAFIVGASYTEEELLTFLWIIIGSCVIVGIMYLINYAIEHQNEDKRKELKDAFEKKLSDFEITFKAGSDRISAYYDRNQSKLKIITIKTSGITEEEHNNIASDGLFQSSDVILSIDNESKKALVIYSSGRGISIQEISYLNENSKKNSSLPIVKEWGGNFFLVDSENGIVACCNKKGGNACSFTPSLSVQQMGFIKSDFFCLKQYAFMQDERNNRLFVITRTLNIKNGDDCCIIPIDYEDIIKVELVEDGKTISSRSTTRTVGGVLVGGALLGGAGAIVGGLSGNIETTRKVSKLEVKMLLRRATSNTISMNFVSDRTFDLSKPEELNNYNTVYDYAVKAKDMIEIIIDKMEREDSTQTSVQNSIKTQYDKSSSIADEILKLNKLKEDGIISNEEFIQLKKELISNS